MFLDKIKKIPLSIKMIAIWCVLLIALWNLFSGTAVAMIIIGLFIDEKMIDFKSEVLTCIFFNFYETYTTHKKIIIIFTILIPQAVIIYLIFQAVKNHKKAKKLLFAEVMEKEADHLEQKADYSEQEVANMENKEVPESEEVEEQEDLIKKQEEYMKTWMKFQCIPSVEKEIAEADCFGADFLSIDISSGQIHGKKYVHDGSKVVYKGSVLKGLKKVTSIEDVINRLEEEIGGITPDFTDDEIIIEW